AGALVTTAILLCMANHRRTGTDFKKLATCLCAVMETGLVVAATDLRRGRGARAVGRSVMKETLAAIDAPHFFAGIVLWDDKVTEAADIVKYMRRWAREKVRDYCAKKGWKVRVVHELERNDR